MLILYLKKSTGLQNRDEQSNNNAKKVQKADAGWHGSHKQEACLMAKDSVNLKSRHFPDISYSIFNKFTYPDACSHFSFFLSMFSYFQMILCLPSLRRRAKHAFGVMKKARTPMTHVLLSAPRHLIGEKIKTLVCLILFPLGTLGFAIINSNLN